MTEPVFRTLVSAGSLAAHLSENSWVIADCRFDLADPGWGERAYRESHIPGASYAHLERDLSARATGRSGRHPLPEPGGLAGTFGQWGIDAGTQVVAYDQDSGVFASRLWWLLRFLGHDRTAVLDGGFRRWLDEHRPVRHGREARREPRRFTAAPRAGFVIDATGVAGLLDDPAWRLLDARAPERFRGEIEPLDPVAGHIPGARNHCFTRNVSPDGTFLAPDQLRRQFDTSLDGVGPDRVVAYCGSGVTACHNLLALEHAGLTGARLFAGSWSEWCSDPARPVERG